MRDHVATLVRHVPSLRAVDGFAAWRTTTRRSSGRRVLGDLIVVFPNSESNRWLPTLQAIADFLHQHGDLVQYVRRDLERGLKNRTTGRPGLTPSQVVHSLILMRVKN